MEENRISIEDTKLRLLNEKKYTKIEYILEKMNGADIISMFEKIEDSKIPLLFRL